MANKLTLVPDEIEAHAESRSDKGTELLAELAAETHAKMSSPQMLVGPLEGAFLRMLARLVQARRILELGTFTGYSALWMAQALPDDGELITVDTNPDHVAVAKRYFSRSPDGKKIRSILAPAKEALGTLKAPFELIFVDADKENLLTYWESCVPLLAQNGLLVVDNVLWSGRVLAPEEASDKAIVALTEHASKDPRVERVLLTVRDGMLLARKR